MSILDYIWKPVAGTLLAIGLAGCAVPNQIIKKNLIVNTRSIHGDSSNAGSVGGNDSPPADSLDDLLAGKQLKENRASAAVKHTKTIAALETFILETVTKDYLVPLNQNDFEGDDGCQLNDLNQGISVNCKIDKDPRHYGVGDRQVVFVEDFAGMEDRNLLLFDQYEFKWSDRYTLSWAKTSKKETLTLKVEGLGRHLLQSGLYVSNTPKISDSLTINLSGGKVSVNLDQGGALRDGVQELMDRKVGSNLGKLFGIVDLIKEKYRINAWLGEHSTEIAQRTSAFKNKQEAKRMIKEFGGRFAQIIRQEASYVGLTNDPEFDKLVVAFPGLADSFFDHTKIKTSLEDPFLLNNTLLEIKEIVGGMPSNYHQLMQGSNTYIAQGRNDLQTLCEWEHAAACYAPKTDTVYIVAGDRSLSQDAIHELGHAHRDRLSSKRKKSLERRLTPLLTNSAVRKDIVCDDKGLVDSWKDRNNGAKYWFVRSYGASNTSEFIATYVEDIYSNGGHNVVGLLQSQHKKKVALALGALADYGFLGNEQERGETLGRIYHQAGLGKEAIKKLTQ